MISGKDITIDKEGSIILNGDKYPLASQAEIDAVKGDIDDIEAKLEELTAITLTGIDISSYNADSNRFTAPTDGYVRMELRNTSQYFYLYVNNSTLLGGEGHQVTNANDYISIFIKKGMNLYYTGTVQTAVFYSLT